MAGTLLLEEVMRHAIVTSLLVVSTASGCLLPSTDGGDDGDGTVGVPPAPVAVASGPYVVTSNVEITVEALLPEPAANLVATLRDFSQHPAHTLLDLADQAGVPAVGTIRSYLPAILEDKLEGWIDGELAKLTVAGVPVPAFAGQLVTLAETTLSQVGLSSTLTVDGERATHRLVALDLAPAGLDVQLALGGAPDEIVAATATARTSRSTLALGDHGFSIAYGRYAWQALDAHVAATYGATIRSLLGAAVSCPAVAHAVASKCVLGQCVGHEAELTQICERGLDEVVARAQAKLESFRFDALHLAAGTATLVDGDHDGVAEALANGVWTAEINAGQGLRPAPATFAATR